MEPTLTFEEFLNTLKYDIIKSVAVNEEASRLKFKEVHTKSDNNFVKYFLIATYFFNQQLSNDKDIISFVVNSTNS